MNNVAFPLNMQVTGAEVANLHSALQLLLDPEFIRIDDEEIHRTLYACFVRDRVEQAHGETANRLMSLVQEQQGYDLPARSVSECCCDVQQTAGGACPLQLTLLN